jgi:hypothetical protein
VEGNAEAGEAGGIIRTGGDKLMKHKTFVIWVSIISFMLVEMSTQAHAQSEYPGRGGFGASKSVYRIICPDQDRVGTAFGHRSGHIITAEHVVHNCDLKKLVIIDSSGARTGIEAIKSDASFDLAVLTPVVNDFIKLPLDISADDMFTLGAQVSTWGFPGGYNSPNPLLSVGYLAGVIDIQLVAGKTVHEWAVNGAFNPGNSGGPILETKSGNVIGVISAKFNHIPDNLISQIEAIKKNGSAENKTLATAVHDLIIEAQLVVGFAILGKDLRDFLKTNGIEP